MDPKILTYKEAAEILKINPESVSQFLKRHNVRRGKVTYKGRRIGVIDRTSFMRVVERLSYTGPIKEEDISWS